MILRKGEININPIYKRTYDSNAKNQTEIEVVASTEDEWYTY